MTGCVEPSPRSKKIQAGCAEVLFVFLKRLLTLCLKFKYTKTEIISRNPRKWPVSLTRSSSAVVSVVLYAASGECGFTKNHKLSSKPPNAGVSQLRKHMFEMRVKYTRVTHWFSLLQEVGKQRWWILWVSLTDRPNITNDNMCDTI